MLRTRKRERPGTSATAAKLRMILPKCPICGQSMEGHFFGLLASMALGSSQEPSIARFFGIVRQHGWSQLAEFNEWNGTSDNLVAYVIRGMHASGVVIVVKNVFELYEQDEIILQEIEPDSEMSHIAKTVVLEWQPM